MSSKFVSSFLVIVLLFHIFDGFHTSSGTDRNYWPTEEWKFSTPDKQGIDKSMLDEISDLIAYHNVIIDGIVIVKNGYVVYRENPSGFALNQIHMIQSCTKSFSSTLIGIAIDQGLISGVDAKVLDFFPDREIVNVDDWKRDLTLYHLLTITDGMDWHEHDYPYTHINNTLGRMWVAPDPIQYILDRPMVREPGESNAYNSGTSMLLGAIIEQVSGMDARTFGAKYLFEPLGIEDFQWIKLKDAYHTDGGLYMKVDDLAKFGYLFLNNGTWDGEQIVSAEWVNEATRKHITSIGGYLGYGYQWWTYPASAIYSALGHYEQIIYVAPNHDLVVAIIANIADDEPHIGHEIMFEFILPSIDRDWTSSNQGEGGPSIVVLMPSIVIYVLISRKMKSVRLSGNLRIKDIQ